MRHTYFAALACLITLTNVADAQHGSPDSDRFELKLAFEGPAVVDFSPRPSDGLRFINGKLATGREPETNVPLPVKFHLRKIIGEPIRFTSRDCTVSVLNSKGEIIPGGVAVPFDQDPKTGMPTTPKLREFTLGDTPVVDDPQMSLFGNGLISLKGGTLKSGPYTLVCCYAGRMAALPFTVKNP